MTLNRNFIKDQYEAVEDRYAQRTGAGRTDMETVIADQTDVRIMAAAWEEILIANSPDAQEIWLTVGDARDLDGAELPGYQVTLTVPMGDGAPRLVIVLQEKLFETLTLSQALLTLQHNIVAVVYQADHIKGLMGY